MEVTRHAAAARPSGTARYTHPQTVRHPRLFIAPRLGQQQGEQDGTAFAIDHAIDQFGPEPPLESDDRRLRPIKTRENQAGDQADDE